MIVRRRRSGFQRVANLPANELGLPSMAGRDLKVAAAWREVVGEALARRAPAIRLRRSVLEVRLPEGEWGRTLRAMLPRLAGRMAAAHPEFGIRRYRLRGDDDRSEVPSIPVPEGGEVPPVPEAGRRTAGREARTDETLPVDERLRKAMESYLSRRSERDQKA